MSEGMTERRATAATATGRTRQGLARRLLLRHAETLSAGELLLVDGSERLVFGRAHRPEDVRAEIVVHDPGFYPQILLGGTIGAGEAYAAGRWSSGDLTAAVRLMLRNAATAERLDRGLGRLLQPVHRLLHRARRNDRPGSRRNIAAHYDLGNDFFASFLDETMAYSCAVFEREDEDLAAASERKNDILCRKLDLQPGDEILEIGGGWGGFALHAASRRGCRVVTTTISARQRELAEKRVREAGLEDRITVLGADYRDLPRLLGRRFSHLVSVEMIEAVGEERLGVFFATCDALLERGGRMALQAIVLPDQRLAAYRRSVDFIQRHIFPGCFLPSLGLLADRIGRTEGLRLVHLEEITAHYATTLRRWRERFAANRDRLRALGYPERLLRLWEFYFCYCEAGFAERWIGDVQLVIEKPGSGGGG